MRDADQVGRASGARSASNVCDRRHGPRSHDRDRGSRGRSRERSRESRRSSRDDSRDRRSRHRRDRDRSQDRYSRNSRHSDSRDRGRKRDQPDRKKEDLEREEEQNGAMKPPASTQPAEKEEQVVRKKRTLISLDDIARKRDAEKAALEKPVFLSKEERTRIREQEAMERLRKKRESQSNQREFFRNSQQRGELSKTHYRQTAAEIASEAARKRELELIKESYLGKKSNNKKKLVPPSQKFKFVFDWDGSEDTSKDLNPLYSKKHDISLGFGRGYLGGVDREEQREKSNAYSVMLNKRKAYLESLKDEDKKTKREEKDRAKARQQLLNSRHWSEKSLAEMKDRDWRIFNEDFNISTQGGSIPRGLRSWEEANFEPALLNTIREVGYNEPTPIQRASIPVGLQGRDVMGIAETGSGKTCAFLLPMLTYILKQPKITAEHAAEGPYAIVLAPTRELAQQIEEEARKFARPLGIRTICIVGGLSIESQAALIRDGCEIIVATPGRLNDCLRKRYLVLNQCNYVVLDEADRMIDMGFEEQVTSILDAMPSSNLAPVSSGGDDMVIDNSAHTYRQTFLFSATMPVEVERLARNYLRCPAYITIGSRTGKAVDRIEQIVEFMSEGHKRKRLMQLLENAEPPIIVFLNQKKACDALSRFLATSGYNPTVLHGGKVQEQREQSLEGFKSGHYDILVATDVAGRGIDIEGVTLVINYDLPKHIEHYMHRIGRTGRAGKTGVAVSFLTAEDTDIMLDLKKNLEATNSKIPPELARHEAARPGRPQRLG